MLSTKPPQRSWLSYLRHEISTPINVVIGYSGLLLEELAEGEIRETPGVTAALQQIQSNGEQLLSSVKSILNAAQLEKQDNYDLASAGEMLRLELEPPANTTIGDCEQLLETAATELIPDITKIKKAAETLLEMIDRFVDLQLPELSNSDSQKIEIVQYALETPTKAWTGQKVASESSSFDSNRHHKQKIHPGNILVVDDNEANQELLSRQLQAQDYSVTTTGSGREALQMVETGQYDLILLDIIMPDMNGYQVLKGLRESQWRNIPVIMISAFDELDSVVKCIEMGAEDYLTKPFNPILLRARINACLEKKQLRDRETLYLDRLAQANQEITSLNERLQAENMRLSAELEVTQKLQQMILPKEQELHQVEALEVSGFMQTADEVGGDYYDVLSHNGNTIIGIGDVTGHGLKSGVLMLMVQTAVRTLVESNETNPVQFLDILNRTIYNNVQRMNLDRHLSFTLLEYQDGTLRLSGQHEKMIIVRASGAVEQIDTVDLGFPIGLDSNISQFIATEEVHLNSGDVAVLYTDGLTEAENSNEEMYGLENLCKSIKSNHQLNANKIKEVVIEDVRRHIGKEESMDDLTLVVLKQK